MNWHCFRILVLLLLVGCATGGALAAEDQRNEPLGESGQLPTGDNGKPLNLNFETGTIDDWTAHGEAFAQQPIQGPISANRPFGEGKESVHTGNYWIGGFEKLRDAPQGVLTSQPFVVSQPYASFLIGGGSHEETRVELVRADTDKVIFKISGLNQENMRPAVVNLRDHLGERIFIRLVDEHSGGWGHVNFDDFRLHASEPRFRLEVRTLAPPAPELVELYPHAGLDAEAAAQAMQLPPGFSVQVGASEPDVMQPIAMALDDRGRLWVAEAYEYPTRAPAGKGRDRILIFEDTDGDGGLDKRKVFSENLNLVSGLEVGFGGVWVGAAPYLLFIPDRDGDDAPDGEPQVLLDGWGYHDTHETLNAFIWGPDGWLYGCHGVFTHSRVGKPGTPDEKRTPINAGIWRYHPTRHQFEVFAEGTSNPWGVDFNARGQAFCTACVIPHLYHLVQGGRYQRQAGQHFNPHTYDDIKTIAKHRHYTGNQWNNNDRRLSDNLGGGHAHAGAMIYLGGVWPQQYRDQIFMNNIHGNRLNQDVLQTQGSGYVGDRAPDFLLTRDQWSQMLYLTYGPDGQAWVIDWYDGNQCHRREEELHDRRNGRIYRISYGQARHVQVNLQTAADDELVAHQLHNNDWYVRHARRVLQERAAAGTLSAATRPALVNIALENPDETRRLRGLWALGAIGGIDEALVARLLEDQSPYVRGWTIQLALEAQALAPQSVVEMLKRLAADDDSPVVRLYVASAVQRIDLESRWDILAALTSHSADAGDHNLPLMYWYAMEPLAEVDAQRALALALSAGEQIPLLARFMIRRIGAGDPQRSLALLTAGLGAAEDDQLRLTFLRSIHEALRGRRQLTAPDNWRDVYANLQQSDHAEVRLQATALALTLGDAAAGEQLRGVLADSSAPAEQRRLALAALLKAQDEQLAPVLHQLLSANELRGEALRGLAALENDQTPAAILRAYDSLNLAERRDALATLCSRPAYAQALLAAIGEKRVPAKDLTADLVRQIGNLGSGELQSQVERVWGVARETAADRLALIEQYKQWMATELPQKPDAELGRAVFAKTCQQCHKLFGSGGDVGPELTGSNRANLDYLLSNIVDPSAVMAKEYQPSIILTADGRVITGIVRQEDSASLTVQTANETVVVPRDEIDEMRTSEKSMMPDDQLLPMSKHQIRSLIHYLASPGQTALLATAENAQELFNDKDLTGWIGDEKLWSVENGEIVGRSPGIRHNAFLMSELAVEDFRLTLEVKLTPNSGNSGIQFRSAPLPDGEMRGYQADVGAGWWGKLYEERGRALLWDKSGEHHVNKNEWNKYEIAAVGSRVRTWINGNLCVDLDDPDGARRGVVALQIHSGGPLEVRFRNLQLTVLDRAAGQTGLLSSRGGKGGKISFRKLQLDAAFRSEGAAVGDFNNDGLADIAAGSVWFAAPDWTMHNILEKPNQFDPKGYSDSFCNFADDINQDGRLDLVVVDFPGKQTWWFENPGLSSDAWPRREAVAVTNNESPAYLDLDGDNRRELLLGLGSGRMGFARPGDAPTSPWRQIPVSAASAPGTNRFSHGLGAGDVNGDGRTDVLINEGWWEAPADPGRGQWEYHPAKFGPACSNIHVYDFDGDGDNDVLTSSAHAYGIWWHEQTGDGWQTHEIDKSFSQTHSLCLADINGDGLPDFVTGKRYWAHGGHDPGGNEPAVMCWFELQRESGKPVWTKHQFDHDSGVGTQFEVADVNNDGLLDVVTANKKGVFYFEQARE